MKHAKATVTVGVLLAATAIIAVLLAGRGGDAPTAGDAVPAQAPVAAQATGSPLTPLPPAESLGDGGRPAPLRLSWAATAAPAGDLVAELLASGAGSVQVHIDESGLLPVDGPLSGLRLVDPVSGLLLLEVERTVEPGEAFSLPEPFRVSGRILLDPGVPAEFVTAAFGTGPRVPAAERVRTERGLSIRPSPDESTAWEVELPPSASLWLPLALDSTGRFTSPWTLADGHAPQVAAHDGAGRYTALDIRLPENLEPRKTVDAGEHPLGPLTGILVTIESPPQGAPTVPIALSLLDGRIGPGAMEGAQLLLSVADRIDPRVADFATGRGDYFMTPQGSTEIAPLPPFESVRLVARGATPMHVAERVFAIPQGNLVRVDFRADELYPVASDFFVMDGTLRLEGTNRPVTSARVVASWFGGRREAFADDDGRFLFEQVPSGQPLTFFVEAFDPASPPRYSHQETKPFPRGEPVDGRWTVEWEVPGHQWLVVEDPAGLAFGGAEDPIVSLERLSPGGEWKPWPRVLEFYFGDDGVDIEIRQPGTWRAVVQRHPLVALRSGPGTLAENDHETVVRLLDPGGDLRTVRLRLLDPDGLPAARRTFHAVPAILGGQPVELLTDSHGIAELGPTNLDEFSIRVEGDTVFEGTVRIGGVSIVDIQLVAGEEA